MFDRKADIGGLGYWVSQVASGESTHIEVVQAFVESSEFQGKYGDLTNEEFVDLLYKNVMKRDADPDGAGLLVGLAGRWHH